MPVTPVNEVILVEQFRYGISEPTLEIPGGIIDEEEQPMETAKRELLEETGFAGGGLEEISVSPSSLLI